MTGVSMPVTRPTGRALIIGSPSCRNAPLGTLQRLGFTCAEIDDPYSAMAELCRRPLVYRALILSLASLYREEMALIQAVKRRWPHVDIWLTQTDGRHAALADAMRLGADGLLSEDGLHRTALAGASTDTIYRSSDTTSATPLATPAPVSVVPPVDTDPGDAHDDEMSANEPILTADELRALLAEQPTAFPEDTDN
jgi:hypothetical protein